MKRLAIVFGGQNTEHSVSIMSTFGICSALDYQKYLVDLLYISEDSQWYKQDSLKAVPGSKEDLVTNLQQEFILNDLRSYDVVLPILHGTNGEDGTIQGLLELLNVPYVGCDIFASAASIDKIMTRRMCEQMNIPLVSGIHFSRKKWELFKEHIIEDILRIPFPLFVKPPKLGSSVGISKITNREELLQGVEHAFSFGETVLIEKGLVVRELEVAILGNEEPLVSTVGEVAYQTSDFYDFETKYHSNDSSLQIPANIPKNIAEDIQKYAKRIYEGLGCSGLARLDFFMTDQQDLYFNEINTFPGFTAKSMYPQLWEATGVPYAELIDRLIELALERKKFNAISIKD